ncbi:MAG: VacJ family lipoprotein [Hyphomonadaceae bacterium]
MRLSAFTLIAVFVAAGCATTPAQNPSEIYDPFENFNRQVYGFNESVDKAVIGPVANGYSRTVPKQARSGVRNFIANANSPVTFVNDVLQGKPQRAAETFSRFIINSTVGLGGLFDVAGDSGLEQHTEDFGQTLGVWGVPMGPYFVAPLLGPSNMRDTTGRVVDIAFDPLTWIGFNTNNLNTYLSGAETIAVAIDTRAELDSALEVIRSQPEPYTALRRGYASQRRSAIRDGAESDDEFDGLPDFDEFDDFDDNFDADFDALEPEE